MKAGIYITHTSDGKLEVRYFVGIDGFDFNDPQTLTYTGDLTGTTNFTNNLSAGSHGTHQGSITDYMEVARKTLTPTAGKKYTFAVKLTGAYEGSTPSNSVTYTEPHTEPSAPRAFAYSNVTSSGATFNWTEPSSWGGDETGDYKIQFSESASFSSPTTVTVYNKTTFTADQRDAGTKYYVRVRAFNSGGDGPWSTILNFTTLPAGPDEPAHITISKITPTTADAQWAIAIQDPHDHSITGAQIQVSTDASFADPIVFSSTDPFRYHMTGLQPETLYHFRVRSTTAVSVGKWSTEDVTFTTLKGSAKVRKGAAFVDVPTFVMVGGVMKPIAPQRRQGGVWVY